MLLIFEANLQSRHVAIWRTCNHPPATRVNGINIPTIQHIVGINQIILYGNQSNNCSKRKKHVMREKLLKKSKPYILLFINSSTTT